MDIIRECMRSPVISIDPQASAEEAARIMSEKNVSALFVKQGDDYPGIVTKTDLVAKVLAKGLDSKTTPVDAVMTKPLLTKDAYLSRGEVHEFMLRKKIKHLGVTQNGKVVGILTTKDLVS